MNIRPYNDGKALTKYIIANYRRLITSAEKRSWLRFLHPECAPDLELHLERVRVRILAEHADEIVLNRCEKCRSLCRTPNACLCPVCNHTWYERRRHEMEQLLKQKNVHVRSSPNLKKVLVTLIAVYGFWLVTGFTLPVNVQAWPPYPRDWSADSQVNPLTQFNFNEGKWSAVITLSMEDRLRKPWGYAYGNVLCTSDPHVLKQLQRVAFHFIPADIATVTSGLYLFKDGRLMYRTGIVLEDGDEGLQNRDHGWMPPVQRGALHAVCRQFRRSWVPVVFL